MNKAFKGRDGWQMESEVALDGVRVLRVSTLKGSRGLRCSVTAVTPHADGKSYTWVMFGDFQETLLADRAARCTEKTVNEMHARAMADIENVKTRALAFYAAKEAKEKREAADVGDHDPMTDACYAGHPMHY